MLTLMLSALQFCLHQNQGQQQEGEGPQKILLEVSTEEGSKERKAGAHGGLHGVEGRTCQASRLGEPSGVFTFCAPRCQVEGRALMTPEGPLKDSEVRPIEVRPTDGSI